MTENNEKNQVTGKQVLSDCVTLVKHLGEYVVCVTVRVASKVKRIVADKKNRKDGKAETDTAVSDGTPA